MRRIVHFLKKINTKQLTIANTWLVHLLSTWFFCYSIDARNREFGVAERWSDNSVFSNRAYFMLDKQPALLGVENTREEDAGIYRCRVDFQIGQTRNSKVNLTVIGKVYFNYSFAR